MIAADSNSPLPKKLGDLGVVALGRHTQGGGGSLHCLTCIIDGRQVARSEHMRRLDLR